MVFGGKTSNFTSFLSHKIKALERDFNSIIHFLFLEIVSTKEPQKLLRIKSKMLFEKRGTFHSLLSTKSR